MYEHEIKNLLLKTLSLKEIYVSIINENYYKIIAIDRIFSDKSTLERHQIIYSVLADYITSNKIHAISIFAFCPKEWKKTII